MATATKAYRGALILLACSRACFALGLSESVPRLQGPLCGVYCVFESLRTLGQERVKLADLATPAYVSSPDGSTAQDLANALTDFGARGEPFAAWGIVHLHLIGSPAILHVSRHIANRYDHWVLYLGSNRDGKLLILDAEHGLEEWGLADLLARWDGTGVLATQVTAGTRGDEAMKIQGIVAMTACAVLSAVAMLWHLVQTAVRQLRIPEMASVVVCAFFMSLVPFVAVGAPASMCGVDDSLAWLGSNYAGHRFPEVPHSEVQKTLVDNRGTTIVDSRGADAFALGHIPGAVNVPVDSTPMAFRKSLQSLTTALSDIRSPLPGVAK